MKCLDRIFSAINFCMIRIYVTYSVSIYNHLFLNYGKKNFHIQNKKRIVVEWVANKWFLSKKVFNIIFSLRYKEFYKHTNYFHPFYPSGLHHKTTIVTKKKGEKKHLYVISKFQDWQTVSISSAAPSDWSPHTKAGLKWVNFGPT